MVILSEDNTAVYDESSTDEVTTDTVELLQQIEKNTHHISQGIDHIFVIGFVLIIFIGIWKVFNNWYFGGV